MATFRLVTNLSIGGANVIALNWLLQLGSLEKF